MVTCFSHIRFLGPCRLISANGDKPQSSACFMGSVCSPTSVHETQLQSLENLYSPRSLGSLFQVGPGPGILNSCVDAETLKGLKKRTTVQSCFPSYITPSPSCHVCVQSSLPAKGHVCNQHSYHRVTRVEPKTSARLPSLWVAGLLWG